MSQRKPREWFVEMNETFDDDESIQSGLAYSQGFLDEMEILAPDHAVLVIEKAYADDLEKLVGITIEAYLDHSCWSPLQNSKCSVCIAIAEHKRKWGKSLLQMTEHGQEYNKGNWDGNGVGE